MLEQKKICPNCGKEVHVRKFFDSICYSCWYKKQKNSKTNLMTRNLFFNRLRSMQINIESDITKQFISRINQCSFINRNFILADIQLSSKRINLLKILEKKLNNCYENFIINKNYQSLNNKFLIITFDKFLLDLFESYNENFFCFP